MVPAQPQPVVASNAPGGVQLRRGGPDGSGEPTDFVTALFTALSALCVTGLVVVDTGTHWSGFGEVVILALIQIGGFGITWR